MDYNISVVSRRPNASLNCDHFSYHMYTEKTLQPKLAAYFIAQ